MSQTKLLLLIVFSLSLAACFGGNGEPRPLDPNRLADAVPKHEPQIRAGNKPVYQIRGINYRVLPTHVGYRKQGIASWYGTKFNGRPTANGEIYDMYAMTAAHKTLPIPCYARVTRTDNGRSIIVRINDRGPFISGRIIDLSYAAAIKLGITQAGTAEVIVEAIDVNAGSRPASPPPVIQAPAPVAAAAPIAAAAPDYYRAVSAQNTSADPASTPSQGGQAPGHYLQIGAYVSPSDAEKARKPLLDNGYQANVVTLDGRYAHKLWIGPFPQRSHIDALRQKLIQDGFEPGFPVRIYGR